MSTVRMLSIFRLASSAAGGGGGGITGTVLTAGAAGGGVAGTFLTSGAGFCSIEFLATEGVSLAATVFSGIFAFLSIANILAATDGCKKDNLSPSPKFTSSPTINVS